MPDSTFSSRPFSRSVLLVLAIAGAASLAPPPAAAVVLGSQLSCQKGMAKASRLYLISTLRILSRCDRERLFAPGTDPCADVGVTDDLVKAANKFDDTVAKACGDLSDEELSDPRPGGLALPASAALYAVTKSDIGRVTDQLLRSMHASSGGGAALSEDAMDCQASLDKAVAKRVTGSFKLIGSSCHDKEDKGKSVAGESSHILEACLETEALELDAAAARILPKIQCVAPAVAELGACPTLESGRTPESVAGCLLDRARDSAGAVIAIAHGRDRPRVIGRIETGRAGEPTSVAANVGYAFLIGHDFSEVASGEASSDGRVDIEVPTMERLALCLQRNGVTSCSPVPIDVGLETVYFGDRRIDFPLAADEQAVIGSVLRSDGSPCFEGQTDAAFALQGGVVVAATGTPAGTVRFPVSRLGTFIVAVPTTAAHTLHADCGTESASVDLGPAPLPTTPVTITMTNPLPTGGAVTMIDDQGTPITDPSQVEPGDVITLLGDFTDTDPLEYRWEITRGDGRFVGVTGDDRHASGPVVNWEVGGSGGIHQVTLWASDLRGGIESIVAPVGPIIGDIAPGPCIAPPKLQKLLCATGYTASVPAPAGGLSEFLTYKYRNALRNSAGDACLYYNLVDPDCIDMNCDGIVDPGTDPLNKCKRTTLGGWWQKNGFDTLGLGSDVVSAWYLNANDLGFGREMHCRVTSWSSIISEKPAGAPTSVARFVESLRSDILASPKVTEFSKLFNLYPSTVACYVTNYTTDHCFNYPTNDPHNANLAYQGQIAFVGNPSVNPTNAYGTVAMEFGPVEGFGDLGAITKFFVYNGRTASGKRLTSANLDGCGPKSVPELCMNCHGGSWPGSYSQGTTLDNIVAGLGTISLVLAGIDATDTAPTDPGYLLRRSIIDEITHEEYGFSSFLPFDPDTFVFPAAAPSATQAPNIRSLNQLVLYTKPVTPIRDIVKGWYGNNLLTGTFAPWRPTSWNDDAGPPGDESDLHDEVYAKACRVCHAAHYSFSSPLYFPGSYRLCKNGSGNAGGSPTMPHAKLTYLNLWKSDYPQALTFATLEAWYAASEALPSCD